MCLHTCRRYTRSRFPRRRMVACACDCRRRCTRYTSEEAADTEGGMRASRRLSLRVTATQRSAN